MRKYDVPLRQWQKKCIEKAQHTYQAGQTNFMCVAAPGAGKTLFSAKLAHSLLQTRRIDFVLCFAPSVSVSNGIQSAFSEVLDDPFDGRMGSKGRVITYQGMQYAYQELAHVIRNYRVLIISDEIHHCSFGLSNSANQWGQLLASLISEGNPITLTLSGTPWRSDNTKIALQNYSGEPEELETDFVYGLGEAVVDKVCRNPSLVLLDNNSIEVREGAITHRFNSIQQAIKAEKIKYGELLVHQESLSHLLNYAHDELIRIREVHQNAAGLIVASSIEQARRISQLIVDNFNERAVLVSYDQSEAHEKIRDFQNSDAEWIVSVGMVSEGTDIPRLQVCAYLSNIRTELYFRQVLGRILRINRTLDEPCSLIAFAEPKLIEFSDRINQDLPEDSMKIKYIKEPTQIEKLNSENAITISLVDEAEEAMSTSTGFMKEKGTVVSIEYSYSTQMVLCKDSYRATILSL